VAAMVTAAVPPKAACLLAAFVSLTVGVIEALLWQLLQLLLL
jgi:hypothetical protein